MSHLNFAVSYTDSSQLSTAKALADRLGLPFINTDEDASEYDYLLIFTPNYLGLHKTAEKKTPPFYIDFFSKKMVYRIFHASLKNELLARGIGIHPKKSPTVIDATGGLGRDSLILAALGFNMIMLEKSPILCALLEDAVARAKLDQKMGSIMQQMHLIHTDSTTWLTNRKADVVYLDPMFPPRKKSASVRKEMLILQNLLTKDDNYTKLFESALACASYRVVVKRPRLANFLLNEKPHFSLMGKTSRFDIYQR